jgi:hypothetical protein
MFYRVVGEGTSSQGKLGRGGVGTDFRIVITSEKYTKGAIFVSKGNFLIAR